MAVGLAERRQRRPRARRFLEGCRWRTEARFRRQKLPGPDAPILQGNKQVGEVYNDMYTHVREISYQMGDLKQQHPTLTGNDALTL